MKPNYDELLEYQAAPGTASLPGATSDAGGFYGQHDHPMHRDNDGERIAPADPRPRPMSVSEPTIGARERELVLEVLEANRLTQGPKVAELERRFAELIGVEHAVATNTGTAALHLALLAAGVGPGDGVLVPALSYIATANVVRYVGAEPVFVDVDAASWCLDVADSVEKAREASNMGLRIAAALPVHMLGHIAPVGALRAAQRLEGSGDIAILEDAAQALGGFIGPQPELGAAGALGDAGAFSFYGSKIATTGEGGMLTTDDAELAHAARLYRGQGHAPVAGEHYRHSVVGYNYRMPELAAAVGLAQLERLGALLACRRAVVERYAELILEADLELELQLALPSEFPAPWIFGVLLPRGVDRDVVVDELVEARIETRPMFTPLNRQPPFMLGDAIGRTPVADDVGRRGLMLPTHANLELEELGRVVDILATHLRARR